jgi:hypothetical protein
MRMRSRRGFDATGAIYREGGDFGTAARFLKGLREKLGSVEAREQILFRLRHMFHALEDRPPARRWFVCGEAFIKAGKSGAKSLSPFVQREQQLLSFRIVHMSETPRIDAYLVRRGMMPHETCAVIVVSPRLNLYGSPIAQIRQPR